MGNFRRPKWGVWAADKDKVRMTVVQRTWRGNKCRVNEITLAGRAVTEDEYQLRQGLEVETMGR